MAQAYLLKLFKLSLIVIGCGLGSWSMAEELRNITNIAVDQKAKDVQTGDSRKDVNSVAIWAIATTHDRKVESGQHEELITQHQIDIGSAKLNKHLEELKKNPKKFAQAVDGGVPIKKRQQLLKEDPVFRKIYIEGGGKDKALALKYETSPKQKSPASGPRTQDPAPKTIAQRMEEPGKEFRKKIHQLAKIAQKTANTSNMAKETSDDLQKVCQDFNEKMKDVDYANLKALCKDLANRQTANQQNDQVGEQISSNNNDDRQAVHPKTNAASSTSLSNAAQDTSGMVK